MRRERKSFGLALASAALLSGCGSSSGEKADGPVQTAATLPLTSAAFTYGQTIPDEFTCTGANRSPPLGWGDPPLGTRSFAMVVEDPDAPNGTFRHWGVYDLPPDRRALEAGAGNGPTKDFVQTQNDFQSADYGGPCPPPGDRPHRYSFRLFALDIAHLPTLPTQASGIADAIDGHVLASGELIGLYAR